MKLISEIKDNNDLKEIKKLEHLVRLRDRTIRKLKAEIKELKFQLPNNPGQIETEKCDVCGNHPSIIIKTSKGTFCEEHVKCQTQ